MSKQLSSFSDFQQRLSSVARFPTTPCLPPPSTCFLSILFLTPCTRPTINRHLCLLRALARKGEGQRMVEPLSLKARSGPGGGEASGGGVSMSLSRAWAVKKTQRGIYTGGKVALLVPPLPLGEEVKGEAAGEDELVVTMYGSDVILSNVKNGQVVAIISCGEGEGKEEIVAFAVHPAGHEIATASRNLMLRFWDWRATSSTSSSSTSSTPSSHPRCLRSYKAHETPVLSMDYDRTGTLLATGGSDRAVKVWDVPGGFCTHNFKGHTGIVNLVVFHPDSARREMLFSASDDCTVRVWSLRGGREEGGGGGCLQVLSNHMSAVTGVGVSEDGCTLITAGRDQIVSVWNIDDTSSSSSSSSSSSGTATATRAGKKGKSSSTSSSSFPASDTVTLIESLPVYEEIEGLVVLTKDEAHAMGQGIWSGSEYGGRLTDAEQDALHHNRHTPSSSRSSRSSSSSSSKKRALDSNPTTAAAAAAAREGAFALAGAKGKVRIYHYKPKPDPFAKGLSIRVVAEQRGPDLYPRGYAGLLKGGRTHPTHLLAITTDHNLQWLRGGSLSRARVLVGYNDQVIAVKYLPQAQGGREGGSSRVVVASNSPQVRIFRLGDLSCECLLEGQHTETVLSLDVSPDGRWVVTGGKDRAVCLWLLEEEDEEAREEEGGERGLNAMCVRRYEGHTDAVSAVAMTRRKAGYLHLAAGGAGGTALAFSAGADRTLKRWVLLPAAAKKTTMSRKSRRELAEKEGGREDEVVTTTTEASASVLGHEKDINSLCVAPNDALLASASQDKTVKLWDTKDLTLVGTLKGHKRGVWCVEFSPIDKCVVTGSGDRTVRIWSLTDFSCLRSLEGHGASVLAATFLRNGLQVLSAGADGLMKLWTIRTQECEATMDGHEERVWALAVAPPGGPGGGGMEGGRQAVTGGGDSVLNVWEDVTKEEEEVALLKAEAMVEKEQALQNSVYRKDYFQAVRLALELARPFRLFKVLQEILESAPPSSLPSSSSASTALDPYIREWTDKDIGQILGYIREWNTNAKNAMVAQTILQGLLRLVSHKRLKTCCVSQPSVLSGLLAYSERHLARADRLLQSSFLVDYTLSGMQLLFPQEAAEQEEGGREGGREGRVVGQGLLMNGNGNGKHQEEEEEEEEEEVEEEEEEEEEESESSSSSSSSEEEEEEEEVELPSVAEVKGKGKATKKGQALPTPPPPAVITRSEEQQRAARVASAKPASYSRGRGTPAGRKQACGPY